MMRGERGGGGEEETGRLCKTPRVEMLERPSSEILALLYVYSQKIQNSAYVWIRFNFFFTLIKSYRKAVKSNTLSHKIWLFSYLSKSYRENSTSSRSVDIVAAQTRKQQKTNKNKQTKTNKQKKPTTTTTNNNPLPPPPPPPPPHWHRK